MTNISRLELSVVVQRVCEIASKQLCIPRDEVRPSSRLIEDLRCDSLDLVELIMEVEDEFLVTLPDEPTNSVGKSIFTRQPFRLSDLAEIVYLQQGSGKPELGCRVVHPLRDGPWQGRERPNLEVAGLRRASKRELCFRERKQPA